MTSEHPTPGELLDLHFGEARGERESRTAAHVAACPRCREELASVEWLESSLAALPEEAPPADGLERVMSRVAGKRRARGRGPGWLGLSAAGAAGVGGSAAVIYGFGAWLLALPPFAQWSTLEPARIASGFGLAALAFFALGSFVTLALAPALLIEAQSRARALAGR